MTAEHEDRPTEPRDVPADHVPDEPVSDPTDRPTVTMLRANGWVTFRVAGYPNMWVTAPEGDTVDLGGAR